MRKKFVALLAVFIGSIALSGSMPVHASAAVFGGTLYEVDGTTVISGKRINVSVGDGAVSSQFATTSGAGTFSVTFSGHSTGTPIVAYVDGDSETRAALVTKSANTGNITGVALHAGTVIVSQESGATSTTIADFGTGSTFDSDIQYSVSGGALTVASGQKLQVWAGKTFSPGTAVAVGGDFTIGSSATFVASTTVSVAGNYSNSGTFTAGSGSVTFTYPLYQYIRGADSTGSAGSGAGTISGNSVAVSGNYAYVAKAGSAGTCSNTAGSAEGCELVVFDVTNPATASFIAGMDASGSTGTGAASVSINDVDVSGNYAYVVTSGDATLCESSVGSGVGCELKIFDISSSTAPEYITGVDVSGDVATGTASKMVTDVLVYGNYAYVVSAGDATTCSSSAGGAIGCELQIYDISNPAVPSYVAGVDAAASVGSGTGNVSFNGIAISGTYAYVAASSSATTCSASAGSGIGCELKVFNISSPAAPAYVAGIDSSGSVGSGTGSVTFNDVFVSGNYAYVVNESSATACSSTAGSATGCEFKVFDVTNPSVPWLKVGVDSTGTVGAGVGALSLTGVFVSGNDAYVISSGTSTTCSNVVGGAIGCEIQRYSVSNPATPAYVSGFDAGGTGGSGTLDQGFSGIDVIGNYAYFTSAADTTTCNNSEGGAIGCELKVFQNRSPSPATISGTLNGSSSFNTINFASDSVYQIGSPLSAVDFNAYGSVSIPVTLTVSRDYYAGQVDFTGGALHMTGATARTVPVPVPISGADQNGLTNTGASGGNNLIDTEKSGNYLYVSTNPDSTTCSNTPGQAHGCEIKIFDVSNPASPTYVRGIDISGSVGSGTGVSALNDIYISGNYLYVLKVNVATTCSNSVGSAVGCELQIYDISNPLSPSYVRGIDASGSAGSGTGSVQFYRASALGNYLYVSSQGNATACNATPGNALGCELKVFDITNPATATLVGGLDSSGSATSTSAVTGFYVDAIGSYVYLGTSGSAGTCNSVEGSASSCELHVYDLSSSTAPTFVVGVDSTGAIGSGTGTGSVGDITIIGNYLFAKGSNVATACSNTPGVSNGCEFQIYDISSPTAPLYVAGIDSTGSVGSGIGNAFINGYDISDNYLYIVHAHNGTPCGNITGNVWGCEIQIFDISSSTAPVYVSGMDVGGALGVGGAGNPATIINAPNDIVVSGDIAYISKSSQSSECGVTGRTGCELTVLALKPAAIIAGDGGQTLSFGDLYVESTATTTMTATSSVSGLFQNASILHTHGIGTLSVGGDFSNTGTLHAPPKLYFSGDFSNTGTFAFANNASSTFNGTSTQSLSGTMTGTSAFGDVTFMGGTVQFSGNASTSDFTIVSGTVQAPAMLTIDGSYQNNGTFLAQGGTMYLTATTTNPALRVAIDSSGSPGAGSGGNDGTSVFVSGQYLYAASLGDASACSNDQGSAGGCELKIFNVANPTNPLYVAGIDASTAAATGTGNLTFKSIFVSGDYAYVATAGTSTACSNTGGSGIGCEVQIYDISEPSVPVYVVGIDATADVGAGIGTSSVNSVYVLGNYLFTASSGSTAACSSVAGSGDGCELKIFDVSTPTSPVYIAGMDVTGSATSTGSTTLNSVYATGTYAYVAAVGNTTACSGVAGSAIGCELKIFDISNPAAPTYVAGTDSTGAGNGNSGGQTFRGVMTYGNYMYGIQGNSSTGCTNSPGAAAGCELHVYNITTPSSPTYVAGADATGSLGSGSAASTYYSMFISDGMLYVTKNGSTGTCTATAGSASGCELQVYSLAAPAAPTYIGGMDTSGSMSGIASTSLYSVYVAGGTAYTASIASSTPCIVAAGSAAGCELKSVSIFSSLSGALTGTSLLNNLYISGRNAFDANASTTNLTIAGTGSYVAAPAALSVSGNYSNSGSFRSNAGTLYLSGSTTQTVSGFITGGNSFYNLVISNISGMPPIGSSSVAFLSSTVGNVFSMLPGTSAQFLSGATSTFAQIAWQGTPGLRVYVGPTSTSSPWGLAVPGSRTTTFVDVQYSNACAGYADIQGGTGSISLGGNYCWTLSETDGAVIVSGGGGGGGADIGGGAPAGAGDQGGGNGSGGSDAGGSAPEGSGGQSGGGGGGGGDI